MLQVKDVSKLYSQRRGVHHIDFSMARGEVVGFLGPNGAGKTTTMRMISGYLYPTSGYISIDGISMAECGGRARSKIGYLPEMPPLYLDMTVKSYLRFVADIRGVPVRERSVRIDEMMDKLGLRGREGQLIRGLSKGYKQRVGLAQAIIHKPELLVLDEPTSGLDPNQIVEIRQLIRELGEQHTVLLSTHILPEVNALCNRVIIIHNGQIVLDELPERLGKAMGQESTIRLIVRGPRTEVVKAITAIPDIAQIDSESEGNEVHLRIRVNEQADAREALFFALANAGYPLLEMKRETTSLEDVFTKLTTEEESGDA